VLRLGRGLDQIVLIFPRDRAPQPNILGDFVVNPEIAEVVGQMAAEDAIARVANPEDVLDLREQACDPGIDQRRLRDLPSLMLRRIG
jgi:hypothetical protein